MRRAWGQAPAGQPDERHVTTGLPLEEISPLFDAPRELVRRNLAALGVLRAAAPK